MAAVLAIVMSLAIPLYESSRRSALLQACQGRIASIYQAEEAYRVRNRTYTANLKDLTLNVDDSCPADGSKYTVIPGSTGLENCIKIACPGAGAHAVNPIYDPKDEGGDNPPINESKSFDPVNNPRGPWQVKGKP